MLPSVPSAWNWKQVEESVQKHWAGCGYAASRRGHQIQVRFSSPPITGHPAFSDNEWDVLSLPARMWGLDTCSPKQLAPEHTETLCGNTTPSPKCFGSGKDTYACVHHQSSNYQEWPLSQKESTSEGESRTYTRPCIQQNAAGYGYSKGEWSFQLAECFSD